MLPSSVDAQDGVRRLLNNNRDGQPESPHNTRNRTADHCEPFVCASYETFPAVTSETRRHDSLPAHLCRMLRMPVLGSNFSAQRLAQDGLRQTKASAAGGQKWNILAAIALLVALVAYHQSQKLLNGYFSVFQDAEWRWDHNSYISAPSTDMSRPLDKTLFELPTSTDHDTEPRNLLIVQTAGSRILDELVDITSRVNRAYARQYRVDYVRISTRAPTLARACFDKAYALQEIALRHSDVDYTGEVLLQQKQQLPMLVQYDVIALLSPDAILIDLDYDLLQLMPSENQSLLAIAGWKVERVFNHAEDSHDGVYEELIRDDSEGRTETLLLNLRHKYAFDITKLWWSMLQPNELTCGFGNELDMLMDAVVSVVKGRDSIASLVYRLDATESGSIGKPGDLGVIKEMVPDVPTSKALMLVAKLGETRVSLQTAADAVCYRYYPRCELL